MPALDLTNLPTNIDDIILQIADAEISLLDKVRPSMYKRILFRDALKLSFGLKGCEWKFANDVYWDFIKLADIEVPEPNAETKDSIIAKTKKTLAYTSRVRSYLAAKNAVNVGETDVLEVSRIAFEYWRSSIQNFLVEIEQYSLQPPLTILENYDNLFAPMSPMHINIINKIIPEMISTQWETNSFIIPNDVWLNKTLRTVVARAALGIALVDPEGQPLTTNIDPNDDVDYYRIVRFPVDCMNEQFNINGAPKGKRTVNILGYFDQLPSDFSNYKNLDGFLMRNGDLYLLINIDWKTGEPINDVSLISNIMNAFWTDLVLNDISN